jgi:hypothetical protein
MEAQKHLFEIIKGHIPDQYRLVDLVGELCLLILPIKTATSTI